MTGFAEERITYTVQPVFGSHRWEALEVHERREAHPGGGENVTRWTVSLGKWATRRIAAEHLPAEAAS